MKPLLIAIWVATIPITAFLLWFAFSDILAPRRLFSPPPEYLEYNPMRPYFRLVFGSMMVIFTLVSAAFATVRLR